MGFESLRTADTNRSIPVGASKLPFFTVYLLREGEEPVKLAGYDGYSRFATEDGEELDLMLDIYHDRCCIVEDPTRTIAEVGFSPRCPWQGYIYPPGFQNTGEEEDD
jgi:hypothetical protein